MRLGLRHTCHPRHLTLESRTAGPTALRVCRLPNAWTNLPLAPAFCALSTASVRSSRRHCNSGVKDGVAAPPAGTRVSFFERSLLEPNSAWLMPGPEDYSPGRKINGGGFQDTKQQIMGVKLGSVETKTLTSTCRPKTIVLQW